MRQLTFIKKGRVEWQEGPEPRLTGPLQAIVRPFVAARCDGDCGPLFRTLPRFMNAGIALHLLDPLVADVFGPKPLQGPFAFGHECIATVQAVGDDVRTVGVGDTVIVPWAISCGKCYPCKNGLTAKCARSGNTMFSATAVRDEMEFLKQSGLTKLCRGRAAISSNRCGHGLEEKVQR